MWGFSEANLEGILYYTQTQFTRERIDSKTGARDVTTSIAAVSADPVVLTPLTDVAEFNATWSWNNSTGLSTHISDLVGTTVRDKPVLPHGPNTPGTVAWQLDSGSALTPHKGVLTYSFLSTGHTTGMYNNPKEGFTEGFGYTPFTEEQKAAARIAVQTWDDLIAPTFKEVKGDGNSDITMANTYTGPAQAHAYIPHDYVGIYTDVLGPRYHYLNRWDKFLGDVWVADPRVNASNGQLEPGQYGVQTLNHELGHSLGLSHPGNYNFSDDVDGDGEPDPITYTYDAQYFQDSHQYSIMSYFDAFETGAQNVDWNVMRVVYASTPMVDDVFVIQQKYGADMTTRTGDTTYGFNATVDVTNEALRFEDGEMATIFTIWDADGNDTLDLSGYYTDSVIDLREGGYSSAGGWGAYDPGLLTIDPATLSAEEALAIIDANNADAGFGPRTLSGANADALGFDYFYRLYFEGNVTNANGDLLNEGLSWKEITGTGSQYLMEQNIGIAYGAVIENAVGGHGNDRINGNHVDNMFTGGAGDDTFVIADHSGDLPKLGGGTRTVTDNSTDTITDFGNGDDMIDLSELGVTWDDLSFETTGANETTVTIDRDGDLSDITLIVQGDPLVQADFLFA